MSYKFCLNSFAAGIKPNPRITFTEWANKEFSLPKESTAEYGRYRSSRTPFVEEILDELSPTSPTEIVVLIKPTQLAGTTIALIFLCGIAALYPGPAWFMQPTDTMVRSFSKKKLTPTIKLISALKDKIKEPRSRQSGNTILQKDFPGGSWGLSGANAGTAYRQESIKYLSLDDFDGFEIDIEGEGSPQKLADRRTGTFQGRKIFLNSTTTRKESSNIERAYAPSSQGRYHVPCPHCGYYQYLTWGGRDKKHGIKFERDKNDLVVDAWYQCKCCQKRISESEKPWMLENGAYVHKYPERKIRGFKYNALVTPLGWINSWAYIATDYLEAVTDLRVGKPEKYIVWLNSFMSEPWETHQAVRKEDVILALRDDRPQGIVPGGDRVAALLMVIDTQDVGFWYEIRAWGYGMIEDTWQVRFGFVDTFAALTLLLLHTEYPDTDGNIHKIKKAIIDTQGHRASDVFKFCSEIGPLIIPLRGQDRQSAHIRWVKQEFYPRTNIAIPGGAMRMDTDVNYFKDKLSGKLNVAPDDPGAWRMCADCSKEWASQMISEAIDVKTQRWVPRYEGIANHAWDISGYGLALADAMFIRNWSKEPVKQEAPRRSRPAGSGWVKGSGAGVSGGGWIRR